MAADSKLSKIKRYYWRCCVPGCQHIETPSLNDISFLSFPRDAYGKKQWAIKILRDENAVNRNGQFKVIPNSKVCSIHFKTEDFIKSSVGIKCLKKNAVPSIFPWTKDTLTSQPANQDSSHEEVTESPYIIRVSLDGTVVNPPGEAKKMKQKLQQQQQQQQQQHQHQMGTTGAVVLPTTAGNQVSGSMSLDNYLDVKDYPQPLVHVTSASHENESSVSCRQNDGKCKNSDSCTNDIEKTGTSLTSTYYTQTSETRTGTNLASTCYTQVSGTETSLASTCYPQVSGTETSLASICYPQASGTETSLASICYPQASGTSVASTCYPQASETGTDLTGTRYPQLSETGTTGSPGSTCCTQPVTNGTQPVKNGVPHLNHSISGYQLFSAIVKTEIVQESSNPLSLGDIKRMIGLKWTQLQEEERMKYRMKAAKLAKAKNEACHRNQQQAKEENKKQQQHQEQQQQQQQQQQQTLQQQQKQNGQQQQLRPQQMGPSNTLLTGFKGVSSMVFVDDAGKDILKNLQILTRAVSLLLDAVVKNLKQLSIPCYIVEKQTPENLAAFVDTLTKLFEIDDSIIEGSTYTGKERNGVLDAGETQLNHTEVGMADSENINDIVGNLEDDMNGNLNDFAWCEEMAESETKDSSKETLAETMRTHSVFDELEMKKSVADNVEILVNDDSETATNSMACTLPESNGNNMERQEEASVFENVFIKKENDILQLKESERHFVNNINAESTSGNTEGQELMSECTNEFIKEIDVLDVISGGKTAPIVLDSGKGVDLDLNTDSEIQTENLFDTIKKSVEHLISNLECTVGPDIVTEVRNKTKLAKNQNDIVRVSNEKVALVISNENENDLGPDGSPVVCKKQKLSERTRTSGIRSSKRVVKRCCHACEDYYKQWNEHLKTSEHKSSIVAQRRESSVQGESKTENQVECTEGDPDLSDSDEDDTDPTYTPSCGTGSPDITDIDEDDKDPTYTPSSEATKPHKQHEATSSLNVASPSSTMSTPVRRKSISPTSPSSLERSVSPWEPVTPVATLDTLAEPDTSSPSPPTEGQTKETKGKKRKFVDTTAWLVEERGAQTRTRSTLVKFVEVSANDAGARTRSCLPTFAGVSANDAGARTRSSLPTFAGVSANDAGARTRSSLPTFARVDAGARTRSSLPTIVAVSANDGGARTRSCCSGFSKSASFAEKGLNVTNTLTKSKKT